MQAFKAAALNIVREYFDSGDAGEVATRLAELEEPGCLNVFVKHVSGGGRGCTVLCLVGRMRVAAVATAVGFCLLSRIRSSSLAAGLCAAHVPAALLPRRCLPG